MVLAACVVLSLFVPVDRRPLWRIRGSGSSQRGLLQD